MHDPSRPGEALGTPARLVHLGLALLGAAAFASGQGADDYKTAAHAWFSVHRGVGIGVAALVAARLALGLAGPAHLRFAGWLPVTGERLRLAWEDVLSLLQRRLPDRPTHVGLAGVVEALGLLAFLLLAATGLTLLAAIEPGQRLRGPARAVKELHEGCGGLLVVFYLAHVGATVAHALAGHHLWRRMLFLGPDLRVPPPTRRR